MSEKCEKCGSENISYWGPDDFGEMHSKCMKCGHCPDVSNVKNPFSMSFGLITIPFFILFLISAITTGNARDMIGCILIIVYWKINNLKIGF